MWFPHHFPRLAQSSFLSRMGPNAHILIEPHAPFTLRSSPVHATRSEVHGMIVLPRIWSWPDFKKGRLSKVRSFSKRVWWDADRFFFIRCEGISKYLRSSTHDDHEGVFQRNDLDPPRKRSSRTYPPARVRSWPASSENKRRARKTYGKHIKCREIAYL